MNFSPIFVFIVGAFTAMLPVIETKGAIPLAMSVALWGDSALNAFWAWLASVIGGILVCFVAVAIFLPFRKILERWKFTSKLMEFCDNKVRLWLESSNAHKHHEKRKKTKKEKTPFQTEQTPALEINFSKTPTAKKEKSPKTHKSGKRKALIAFVFCALPIPFSGVWSAAALCSVLKLGYMQSVLTLALANTVSAILIGLFCFFLNEFIDVILCSLLIMLAMMVVYRILKALVLRLENNKNAQSGEITEK